MDISVAEIIFWIIMVMVFGASIVSSAADKKKKARRAKADFGDMEETILKRAAGFNYTGGNKGPAPREEVPREKPRAEEKPPEGSSPGGESPAKLSPGKAHRSGILERISKRPPLVSAMLFREILDRPPLVGDRDRRRGF